MLIRELPCNCGEEKAVPKRENKRRKNCWAERNRDENEERSPGVGTNVNLLIMLIHVNFLP